MTDSQQPVAHHCPPALRKYVIVVAFLASAMGFIDGSIVAIALPKIRQALGADFTQAQWISNAYVLFLSAFILLGGGLGDRLGVKFVFGLGIVGFIIMSLACALAWSPESLIVFRALQGAASAIMLPGSMALIARNTPREQRAQALGIWIASSSITTALGPFIGGFLLTYGGEGVWRWIFAINLPIGLLALYFLWRKVPLDAARQAGGWMALDWKGGMLITLAMGLLAASLTMLGEKGGAWAALVLVGLTLLATVYAISWELKTDEPMIEMRLFRSRAFSGANILTFLIWSCMGALTFFIPMLIIVSWKLPASYAGSMFLPFSAMISVLSVFAGKLIARFGVKRLMSFGALVYGLGCVWLAMATQSQDYWTGILPGMMVVGFGVGLIGPTVSAAAINAVDEDKSGTASGINNMMARLSYLFAVAGLGLIVTFVHNRTIETAAIHDDIKTLMIDQGFGERLTGPLYQISTVALQEEAMGAAALALLLVMAAMSVVAAVVSWTMLGEAE